jgi:hypothetical protein
MGNWRTVNIRGHIAKSDVKSIVDYLSNDDCWETLAACLHIGRSCYGLNTWIKEDGTIDAVGNLAERDFDNDDIEGALRHLAGMYPSLELTLHSGSDWEELPCTATFHVSNGEVKRCAPEIEELEEPRMNLYWL